MRRVEGGSAREGDFGMSLMESWKEGQSLTEAGGEGGRVGG